MKICYPFALSLLLSTTAFADTVYKWVDEKGQVHFGDKSDAPKNSTKMAIKVPENTPTPAPDPAAKAALAQASAPPAPGKIDDATMQKCLEMGGKMARNPNLTPPEIRAESKKLLDLCPGTAYECVFYVEHPQDNKCKAVPLKPNGNITTGKVFQR
jgi:hypothetical protein